jgi:23S rRNA (cytidine2498-2'-O)-methyltransferase
VIAAAYLAAEGFEPPLAEELARRGVAISNWHGRLALSPDPPVHAAWALDTWTDPREIEVPTVRSAADALRAMQRNWAAYGAGHHRRMALIAERLPPVKPGR